MISKKANAATGFHRRRISARASRETASGNNSTAPIADLAKTSTGTDTSSTATLIIRYGIPQMTLMTANRVHPRGLTPTTLRTGMSLGRRGSATGSAW